MRFFRLVPVVVLLIFVGCKSSDNATATRKASLQQSVAVAVVRQPVNHLYFRGILNPIKSIPVLSPVDGSIVSASFVYGQAVRDGDTLVTLDATQLAAAYRTALSDYLQRKSDLETQQAKFNGDQALFKAGVISQQDFDSSRNAYSESQVSLVQSRFELRKILETVNMDFSKIEKLKIGQAKSVAAALRHSFSHLVVKSPGDGVVLIPVASGMGLEDSKNKPLLSGESVKALQPLLSLGDLSGFSVDIKVGELDVTHIKPGLSATVSGDAFPGITLQGVIRQVAVQADPNQLSGDEGGMSQYAAVVEVPNVSEAARKSIRVGMTAKVDVQIKQPPSLMLPINAVFSKHGETYVTVIDPKTQGKSDVLVETGNTTPTEVIIRSGLKAGDHVVVRHDD